MGGAGELRLARRSGHETAAQRHGDTVQVDLWLLRLLDHRLQRLRPVDAAIGVDQEMIGDAGAALAIDLGLGDCLRREVTIRDGGVMHDHAAERIRAAGGIRRGLRQTAAQVLQIGLRHRAFRQRQQRLDALDVARQRLQVGLGAGHGAGAGAEVFDGCAQAARPACAQRPLHIGQEFGHLRFQIAQAPAQLRQRIVQRAVWPLVTGAQRLLEVADGAVLVFDGKAVVAAPTIERQTADHLVARLLIPVVDLLVGAAHPTGVAIFPAVPIRRNIGSVVGFGDVARQGAHGCRHHAQKILVGSKLLAVAIERNVHRVGAADDSRVRAAAVGVQGKAVALARHQLEHLLEILDPIAGIRVPGRDGSYQHLSAGVHRLDRTAAEAVTAGIQRRRDLLLWRFRLFLPHVRLVADDPDAAAGRIAHEVGAAPGEVFVARRMGDGAGLVVAIIQAHDDAQPASRQMAILPPALIVRVGLDLLRNDHPTRRPGVQHQLFAAGVMQSVQILRIEQRTCHW